MSIWIVSGKPRHGKTTFVCSEIIRWQEFYKRVKEPSRQIISNVPLYLPGVQLMQSWDEMQLKSKMAICVIDEAPEWFSSHNSKDNQRHMNYFSQHGKEGNTIYLIAHHPEMLDVSIRSRTCEGIWRIKRMFGPNQWERPSAIEKVFGWWALARLYDAVDYGKSTKQVFLKSRKFRIDKYHGMFETLARVGTIDKVGITMGAGLAAGPGQVGRAVPAPVSSVTTESGLKLTKEEYFAWSQLHAGAGGSGGVSWQGPTDPASRAVFERMGLADDISSGRFVLPEGVAA